MYLMEGRGDKATHGSIFSRKAKSKSTPRQVQRVGLGGRIPRGLDDPMIKHDMAREPGRSEMGIEEGGSQVVRRSEERGFVTTPSQSCINALFSTY